MEPYRTKLSTNCGAWPKMAAINLHIPDCSNEHIVLVCGAGIDPHRGMDC